MFLPPITASAINSTSATAKLSHLSNSPALGNTKGVSFEQVKSGLDKKLQDFGNELNVIQSQLASGKTMNPQELLLCQIKVNQFHVKVEMVSKVAEGAVTTIKRLQNG